MKNDNPSILSVTNLSVSFSSKKSFFKRRTFDSVLTNVNLELFKGKITALVGESGSGKTTIGNSFVGLIRDFEGEFKFKGEAYDPLRMEHLRSDIQYIFQDSLSALNPRKNIGSTIEEVLLVHQSDETLKILLDQVQLSNSIAKKYPHQLSGGQRQRVNIARALAVDPLVLICDEIVSSLDVSVQAKILNLINSLIRERKLSILFITHDLNVVKSFADYIIVIHGGRIVETGEAQKILQRPVNNYTKKLIAIIQ